MENLAHGHSIPLFKDGREVFEPLNVFPLSKVSPLVEEPVLGRYVELCRSKPSFVLAVNLHRGEVSCLQLPVELGRKDPRSDH